MRGTKNLVASERETYLAHGLGLGLERGVLILQCPSLTSGVRVKVWCLGFGDLVFGFGFWVWVLGFGVLDFGVWGLGFWVWGLGFGVDGLGI